MLTDVIVFCIIILLQTLFGLIWLAFFMCPLHLKLEFFFSHFKYQNYQKKKKKLLNDAFIIYK